MKWSYNLLFVVAVIVVFGRAEANAPGVKTPLTAKSVIYKFSRGNSKFLRRGPSEGIKRKFNAAAMFDKLVEDPVKPLQRKAIVVSDSRAFAAVDELFNVTEPGEIQVIRVAGGVCKKNDEFGGVLGSVEYALLQHNAPPLLLVLGNSKNEVVEDAVRLALANGTGGPWEDSPTVKAVLPAAKDAILQDPSAAFEDICDKTAKLNVWNTIEAMLVTSRTLYDKVKSGKVEVHGAFLDSDTGKVHFMGEHPGKQSLLLNRPAHVRTAKSATVPPEQALAMLYAGNKRYQKGQVTSAKYLGGDRNKQLTASGQSPFAIIVSCSDSRAPPEILFDARPGNLFAVRTAGNTWAAGRTSTLGSVEYAVDHLRSKLIVVMGHSKCGAVTATVDAVKARINTEEIPGSVGRVIEDLYSEAAAAVRRKPNEASDAQVKLAAELNVFATIEKIVKSSALIQKGIRENEVQVVGTIYDIETGEVQWLGQHPRLENIVGAPLPLHTWKYSKPYARAHRRPGESVAQKEVKMLREGNKRFRSGHTAEVEPAEKPFAIVLAGSELPVPAENIFDTSRGQISVQRSMGNIAGHSKSALFDSIEYSVQKFSPKLILVLGASDSNVVHSSLEHLDGEAVAFGATHIVHEAIGASALDAVTQTTEVTSSKQVGLAGRDMKQRGLTVELNALYTVEQLLRKSKVIRNAVKRGELAVEVGILSEDTGKVDFIGPHPMQEALVNDDVMQFVPPPVQAQAVRVQSTVTQRDSGAYFQSNPTHQHPSKENVQAGLPIRFGSKDSARGSGAYFQTR